MAAVEYNTVPWTAIISISQWSHKEGVRGKLETSKKLCPYRVMHPAVVLYTDSNGSLFWKNLMIISVNDAGVLRFYGFSHSIAQCFKRL